MDTRTPPPSWLHGLESRFLAKGIGGDYLFYILGEFERNKVIDFPALLYELSTGHGCGVHEHLHLAMENDFDDPSQFQGVTVFFSNTESVVPMDDAIELFKLAGAAYCEHFPDDAERVHRNLERIERRYRAQPKDDAG